MGSQILIMDKGIAFVSYVHECGIESGHNLAHLTEIDIAYRKAGLRLLAVQFDKHLVFAKCDVDFCRCNVYY